MYSEKEIFTSSNLISILRLVLAVPLWILLNNFDSQSIRSVTVGLCFFAAFTDILDGYLARKFNEVSEFGKVIDPLADKIVVGALIIKLFLIGEIPAYYFAAIIGRDILIFFGGLFVTKKIGSVLPSNVLGKVTVINISLIILLIILKIDRANIFFISLYILSIILMAASLAAYAQRAFEAVKTSEPQVKQFEEH